jgi:hypothetical protein
MKSLKVSAAAVSALALCLAGPTVKAKDKTPGSITVAFGTGNNNSTPGNKPNHHIIPQEFKVRITKARMFDGTVVAVPATVNFIVSGFHWVWAYEPQVTLEQVRLNVPAGGTFVNYEAATVNPAFPNDRTKDISHVYAKGIFPGTPPAGFTDGAPFPLSPAQNRTDTIAFSTPGTYLVICNVRGHFLDAMYAWVKVVDGDDDDDHGAHAER